MSALIIGGDKLGRIKDELYKKGFTDIDHITGRKKGENKEVILLRAEKADVVIVLVDFINHCIVTNLKNKISNPNIIYSKRAWSYIEKPISDFVNQDKN